MWRDKDWKGTVTNSYQYNKEYYGNHKEHCNEIARKSKIKRYYENKKEIYNILGNKCIQCGFNDLRALHIDHVNGGGSKLRKISHDLLYRIYKELLTGSKDYQLLCANCNMIKKYNENNYNENISNKNKCYHRIRNEAIEILGEKCNKCNEFNKRVLNIDHIKGKGCKERREIGIYRMCKRVKIHPEDYQLLCANCNWIKRFENKER